MHSAVVHSTTVAEQLASRPWHQGAEPTALPAGHYMPWWEAQWA